MADEQVCCAALAADVWDEACLMCGDGGELVCCDFCPRVYHLPCIGLQHLPGGIWECPSCQGLVEPIPGLCWVDNSVGQVAATPPQVRPPSSKGLNPLDETASELRDAAASLPRHVWEGLVLVHIHRDVRSRKLAKWRLARLLPMEVVRRTSEVYEQSRDPAQALVQGLFEIHAQGRGAEPQQSKTHHIAGAAEPPPCRQDSAFAITPDTQQHCNVPTFAADDLGGHLLSPERASCQVARHGIPAASSPDQVPLASVGEHCSWDSHTSQWSVSIPQHQPRDAPADQVMPHPGENKYELYMCMRKAGTSVIYTYLADFSLIDKMLRCHDIFDR
ncbi:hypothetical protein CYMTET_50466 [Cymbomonas tetramitiformis]|uniref:PHD-type domain-containing protein n=1 Tax=Cymbomonas tetramitiformis TaxID=36881 RepID=A0AAE0BQ11_9CHLO|nr:hypothetical protein CYMTET_50466 [Cymbomonas tetramitiformis]